MQDSPNSSSKKPHSSGTPGLDRTMDSRKKTPDTERGDPFLLLEYDSDTDTEKQVKALMTVLENEEGGHFNAKNESFPKVASPTRLDGCDYPHDGSIPSGRFACS